MVGGWRLGLETGWLGRELLIRTCSYPWRWMTSSDEVFDIGSFGRPALFSRYAVLTRWLLDSETDDDDRRLRYASVAV